MAAVRASGRPWTAVCGLHTLVHAGSLWAGHACDEVMGEGATTHVAGAVGCGALLRLTVYGAWAVLPPPITG